MPGTVFNDDFVIDASQSSTGVQNAACRLEYFKDLQVVIPPKEIVLNYQLFKNGIINKIEKSVIQNKQLSELRNWLLNMLMNEQVTVGD